MVCLNQGGPQSRFPQILESLSFADRLHKRRLSEVCLVAAHEEESKAEAPKVKKIVRFELPTENKDIDSSFRERLQHNLLYKDDTIFEHMAFF